MSMRKVYRDNRRVPPVIALVTICLLWWFIDPSARYNIPSRTRKGLSVEGGGSNDASKYAPQDEVIHSQTPEVDEQTVLTDDDVLLILKTGSTVLWRRLPIHLATTLTPNRVKPNGTAIYSDAEATIGNHNVIDILAQLPKSVKDSPAFELYHVIRDWDETNYYLEQTGLPGDVDFHEGPPGGWRLDKYKFLPLIQHAGKEWPHVKWYIYTEDDTYLFLPNILLYLSEYDHRQSHYIGGLGEKLGTTFAHGGSGFALSRGAWEKSFGRGGDLVTKYQGFVDDACCGDYALGKVLNDYDVWFGDGKDDRTDGGSWGFNGLPHWKIEFSQENWCKPVLTWHHAHNRDIARYYELEKSWDFSKPLNYGDFYAYMIAPSLSKRKEWWENLSSRYEVHSTSLESAPRPKEEDFDTKLWAKAWISADSCEAACKGWSKCVQWYYYGDDCKMDDRVFLGHGYPEGMRYRKDKLASVSGWLTDRVASWKCN
ncbi:hypothetical protein F5883DRAFT_608510 [Diaporthe sp. PMI_573]|nr:hypothetical protein F5883DRAFT_608510 [Diaporthaceae sp. PMI_573]